MEEPGGLGVMAHLMTDGRPCGLPDGHNGSHRSTESIKQRREASRVRWRSDPCFRQRNVERKRQWRQSPRNRLLELLQTDLRRRRQRLEKAGLSHLLPPNLK